VTRGVADCDTARETNTKQTNAVTAIVRTALDIQFLR
jgi:hypothetical protein